MIFASAEEMLAEALRVKAIIDIAIVQDYLYICPACGQPNSDWQYECNACADERGGDGADD